MRENKRKEVENTQAFLSNIENILVNEDHLILDRIFDMVGFNQIENDVFRKAGFSKEDRHKKIILGILVSLNGYPLTYCHKTVDIGTG